jgi:hypothetical protein
MAFVIQSREHLGNRVWAVIGTVPARFGRRHLASVYTLSDGTRCLTWAFTKGEAVELLARYERRKGR